MIRHGEPPYLECSSKGFKPFSAFYAKLPSGKSIEERYQAYKVFEDGSTGLSWREAKGRKAVNQEEAAEYYERCWRVYLRYNMNLIPKLMMAKGLSDIFGQEGHVCQATILWKIRGELCRVFHYK
jgi:sulfatase maturation enzyme AslB (radical SAM superfamily)